MKFIRTIDNFRLSSCDIDVSLTNRYNEAVDVRSFAQRRSAAGAIDGLGSNSRQTKGHQEHKHLRALQVSALALHLCACSRAHYCCLVLVAP